MTQDAGVKLTVEEYNAFMSSMKAVNAAMGETAKAMKQLAATSQESGKSTGQLAVMGGAIAGAVGAAISAVLSLAGAIGKTLFSAVQKTIGVLSNAAKQGLMLAGRYQEMANAAIAVGRAYGMMDDEVRDAINTLEDAGIRYDIAATSATQLIRNQIDLANATDLARIAQATGIIVGADSSETMGRLTHAIATGNTAMLGYMGILVKKEEIEQAALETYGRSISALTQQEKMQARVNAIIKASVPIMGVYESAMESPTKALRSLIGRELPDLQATMMQTFIPAFKSAVDAARNLTKWLIKAMDEGGALYPVLVRLGAVAAVVADAVNAFVESFTKGVKVTEELRAEAEALGIPVSKLGEEVEATGNSILRKIATVAEVTIKMAFDWGIGLISAFVQGIADGLQQLVDAMQWINDLLTRWLAPGSPPLVVPNIDKWGAETMNEWLQGFTRADFSILEAVQGPLRQILEREDFQALSADLIGDIATGGIDESFFDRIAEAAGVFGQEIAELGKQQLALADAVGRVEEAEQNLQAARDAAKDAEKQVDSLTREYNALLKAGADDAILATKLDEINAAEDAMTVAQEQIGVAEEGLSVAEQEAAQLQEQLYLQEQLINQLIALQQQQQAVGNTVADVGQELGNLSGSAQQTFDEMSAGAANMGEGISSSIMDAVENAKAAIRDKLLEMFAPLITAWDNLQKEIDKWKKEWGKFTTLLSDVWEEAETTLNEGIQWLKDELGIHLPEASDILSQNLTTTLIQAFVRTAANIAIVLVPRLVDLKNRLFDAETSSKTLSGMLVETLMEALADVATELLTEGGLIDALRTFGERLDDLRTGAIKWIIEKFDAFLDRVSRMKRIVGDLIALVQGLINAINNVPSIPNPFGGGGGGDGGGGDGARRRGAFPGGAGVQLIQQQVQLPVIVGAAAAGGSTFNRSSTVNIGNVTIGGDMSFAEFRTRVERAILTMG